jgi:hypothetical protein
MKKIVLGFALGATVLMADVATILPYGGTIDYGNDSGKSAKNRATLLGVHASVGDASYLVEFDYAHIGTTYKDSAITDLSQNDITLVYGKYYKNFMFRVGAHYINTNDPQLENGIVAITSLGGYQFYGYDKLSYGVEGYYSYYNKGQDELGNRKKIGIYQFTPYISFYKSINANWGNTFALKGNYQKSGDYVDDTSSSYEVSDTIFYKSLFTTLKYFGGEMRTGVKDAGMTVFNTLDLYKSGYDFKVGYIISPKLVISASYGKNRYVEYGFTDENTNSVAVASLSYSF